MREFVQSFNRLESVMNTAKSRYCHNQNTLIHHGYITYEFNARIRLYWFQKCIENQFSKEQLARQQMQARLAVFEFVKFIGSSIE